MELQDLPWDKSLDEWDERKIRFIEIRKGLSRHTVRFVKTKNYSFAIKETSELSVKLEFDNYIKLLESEIHTLIPIGKVICERPPIQVETKVGTSYEKDNLAFIITLLDTKVIPDSYLFRYNFKDYNKKIIWNAIAQLFAQLHFIGVYWGDASLSNVLVRFFKIKDERGRIRTELKAILADAETVQFIPELSKELRHNELEFFFESMDWINEDLKNSGVERGYFSTLSDKKYILQKYKEHFMLYKKLNKFQIATGIDVKRHFKEIKDVKILIPLMQQIKEHKWYLSEKENKEIPLKRAAQDWLVNIYQNVLKEFEAKKLFEEFPFMNSAKLYFEIMLHKYFLSIEHGRDIGIDNAIVDYSNKFGTNKPKKSFINQIIKTLYRLIPKF